MSKHQFSSIRIPIEPDNPAIIRDDQLCIKCGQCRQVCEKEIAVGRLYDLTSTQDTAICIHCGQCANICPVNAITERKEYEQVRLAINDPDKIVIFSTSPSVRVGLGEEFLMPYGSFVEGKMVAALRALGADYVLDTNFSADLTIMEEASELVKRITKQTKPLPQFTSCCPAWVKFAETFYPAILPHISTAKSPIGMQGPTIKTFFAKLNDLDSKKIINVAVTPCTAKKFEIRRPEMKAAADYLNTPELRDMDYVITTRELAQWLKEEKIDFAALDDADYDTFMGAASGAGVIFGNTGGVMEAAARTAYYFITGENPPADFMNLQPVRGMDGIREAKVTIADVPLRLAIVHGTENARQLIESWQKGETTYDFVEVMTCRGGCIGGGGQPKAMPMTDEIRTARINALYAKDSQMTLRLSHENPDIKKAYKEFYASPLSELAEALLHTDYIDRSSDLGEAGIIAATEQIAQDSATPRQSQTQYRCTICGYIHDGDLPDGFICPTCGVPKELFEAVAAPSTPSEKPVDIAPPPTKSTKQYRCTICGYIHDGDLPEDFTCPLCGVPKELFEEVN